MLFYLNRIIFQLNSLNKKKKKLGPKIHVCYKISIETENTRTKLLF